nr:MAG TPA: hypothetical protein [Caudoviricetes sp.]
MIKTPRRTGLELANSTRKNLFGSHRRIAPLTK